MAVPFPLPAFGLLPLLVLAGALAALLVATALGPPLVRLTRQHAYERIASRESVRLDLRLAATADRHIDPVALVRALHAGQRRGLGRFGLGWPSIELRFVWQNGRAHWQIDCPAQEVDAVRMALDSLVGRLEIVEVVPQDSRPVATASARLAAPEAWPLREPTSADAGVVDRLAGAVARHVPRTGEVRFRVTLTPLGAAGWPPVEESAARVGIGRVIGGAILDAVLGRPTGTSLTAPTASQPTPPSSFESVGFWTRVVLEAAELDPVRGQALLWKLLPATDVLRLGPQSLTWTVRPGAPPAPAIRLSDASVAALWQLPGPAFDRLGLARERALAAPSPTGLASATVTVGATRHGSLELELSTLGRHLAVFGATGSGKTTLLLDLVQGLLAAGVGVTVVDPHGDLAADVLGRVPPAADDRIHVLRLADAAHPRGFNFLEQRAPGQAQLVTSEFVDMFEDLWPRFCGPKMLYYLRNAVLTLLEAAEPQTILELVRLLTVDAVRDGYVRDLEDPVLAGFWANEWPGPKERERDSSIKAVLNKLGAFVSYGSIRSVVGQGRSTISPRSLMDTGDALVVDLSGVGGDNASLFGAMLVSRFYIDAVGRRDLAPRDRRQHVLVVDEVQRFDTRALGRIAVEGRKFGLGLVVASQSLGGLGTRLRDVVTTNAASLALLSPGADDVRALAPLFAPLTADDLLRLQRFEIALRTQGPDGAFAVYGGIVRPPGPANEALSARLLARSDERDARPAADVAAEVRRRAGALDSTARREAFGDWTVQ